MKKESTYLAVLSVFTTLGLCLTANLAYINWLKPTQDTVANPASTSNLVSGENEYKNTAKKARNSYAS